MSAGCEKFSILVAADMVATNSPCIVLFLGALSFSSGWKVGQELEYSYTGRSVATIRGLGNQFAVVQVKGVLVAQAIDESTLAIRLNQVSASSVPKFVGDSTDIYNADYNLEEQSVKLAISENEAIERPFQVRIKDGKVENIKVSQSDPTWVINIKKSIASSLQLNSDAVRGNFPMYEKVLYHDEKEANALVNIYENTIFGNCKVNFRTARLTGAQILTDENYDFVHKFCLKTSPIYQLNKQIDLDSCSVNTQSFYNHILPSMHACRPDASKCGTISQRAAGSRYYACQSGGGDWRIVRAQAFDDSIVKPFGTESQKLSIGGILNLDLLKVRNVEVSLAAPEDAITFNSLAYQFPESVNNKNEIASPGFEDAPSTRPVNILETQEEIIQIVRDVAASIARGCNDSHIDTTDRLNEVLHYVSLLKLSEIKDIAQKVANERSTVRFLLLDVLATAGTPATVKYVADVLRSGELKSSAVTPNVPNIAMSLFYYVEIPSTEVLADLMDLVKFSGRNEKDSQLHTTALMGMAELLFHACVEHKLTSIRFPTRTYGRFCSQDDAVYKEYVEYITGLLNGASTKFETMAFLTAAGTLGTSDMFSLILPYIRGVADSSPSVRSRAVLALHRYAYLDRDRVMTLVDTLYDNPAENPEVRMAALSVLLHSNATFATWQKVAWNSWFEKNDQVAAFASSLVTTVAEIPENQVQYSEMISKAKAAKNFMKVSDYRNHYSSANHGGSWSKRLNAGYILYTPSVMGGYQEEPLMQSYNMGFQTGPDVTMLLQTHLWKYGIKNLYQKVYQAMSPPSRRSPPRTSNLALPYLESLFKKLGIEKHPDEETNTFIQITMLQNMHRLLSLDSIDKTWPKNLKNFDQLLRKDGGFNFEVQKFQSWKNTKISYPSVMGLPVIYENHIPVLASAHINLSGTFNTLYDFTLEADGNMGVALDNIGQLRMDLPFVNSYIASGVESHLQIALPRKWKLGVHLENDTDIDFSFSLFPSEVKRNLFESKVTPFCIIGSVSNHNSLTQKPGFEQIYTLEKHEVASSVSTWLGQKKSRGGKKHSKGFKGIFSVAPLEWIFPGSLESQETTVHLPMKIRNLPELTIAFQRSKTMKYDSTKFKFFKAGSISEAPQPANDSMAGYDFESDADIKGGKLFYNKLMTSSDGKEIASVVVHAAEDFEGLQKFIDVVLSIEGKTKCLQIQRKNPVLSEFESTCGCACNLEAHASLIFGEGKACRREVAEGEIIYTRTAEQFAYAEASPEYKECQKHMRQGIKNSQQCHKARILAETYDKMSVRIPEVDKHNILYDMSEILKTIKEFIGIRFTMNKVKDDGSFSSNVTFTHDGKNFDAITRGFGEETRTENVRNYYPEVLPFTPRRSLTELVSRLGVRTEYSQCFVSRNRVHTFDGVTYNYTIDSCPHLITSDCSSRSKFAVLVMQEPNKNLGLEVITESDRYYISSEGVVDLNMQRKIDLDENGIMTVSDGRVSTALYKKKSGDYLFVLPRETFSVYFRGNDITIKSSAKHSGRLCGLCGDMNLVKSMEFFDPKRCALNSGALMADSYRVQTSNCPPLAKDQQEVLDLYRQECQPVDETIRSVLPIAKKTMSSHYRENLPPYLK